MDASKRSTPPLSMEAQENKMIAKTFQAIDKDFEEGKAAAQIKLHFLKKAGKAEDLEIENLRLKNELLEAKIKAEQAVEEIQKMFDDLTIALKSYTVSGDEY